MEIWLTVNLSKETPCPMWEHHQVNAIYLAVCFLAEWVVEDRKRRGTGLSGE